MSKDGSDGFNDRMELAAFLTQHLRMQTLLCIKIRAIHVTYIILQSMLIILVVKHIH